MCQQETVINKTNRILDLIKHSFNPQNDQEFARSLSLQPVKRLVLLRDQNGLPGKLHPAECIYLNVTSQLPWGPKCHKW